LIQRATTSVKHEQHRARLRPRQPAVERRQRGDVGDPSSLRRMTPPTAQAVRASGADLGEVGPRDAFRAARPLSLLTSMLRNYRIRRSAPHRETLAILRAETVVLVR
jgi:hypothetical protein